MIELLIGKALQEGRLAIQRSDDGLNLMARFCGVLMPLSSISKVEMETGEIRLHPYRPPTRPAAPAAKAPALPPIPPVQPGSNVVAFRRRGAAPAPTGGGDAA